MKVKSSIFKRKALDKWSLQLTFLDSKTGKVRTREKRFNLRKDAVLFRDQFIRDIEKTRGGVTVGARMLFADLCHHARSSFYQPAVFAEGRKVAGVRSYKTFWGFLDRLAEYFGERRIEEIERADLTEYRLWRLRRRSRRGTVSLTTVNRELSAMRRMMKHAFHEGWVTRDIFAGAKVIDVDAERARTRLLTAAEEDLLLEACEGTRQVTYTRTLGGKTSTVSRSSDVYNPFLRAVILLALDSALRRGEILKLRWQDLDLENKTILVVGTHTKTERERMAPMTDRTIAELRRLPTFGSTGEIFPFSEFKRSWATAKRIAGIDDLRFHDLRRTAITKFNMKGIPLATAGKIAGHARLETTVKHYISTDEAIVRDVARILNETPVFAADEGDFVN